MADPHIIDVYGLHTPGFGFDGCRINRENSKANSIKNTKKMRIYLHISKKSSTFVR